MAFGDPAGAATAIVEHDHATVEPSEVSGGGQACRSATYDDAVEFH